MIASVRLDTVQIDDTTSHSAIMLGLACGNEFALNDVWVYGLNDE
jgi:hypothetical protein